MRVLFILGLISTSACSSVTSVGNSPDGEMLLYGDSQGIQAFGDVMNGIINNTKTSPEVESSHYKLRREQVKARAVGFKVVKPGEK